MGVPCSRLLTARSTRARRRACGLCASASGLSSGWGLWGDRDVRGVSALKAAQKAQHNRTQRCSQRAAVAARPPPGFGYVRGAPVALSSGLPVEMSNRPHSHLLLPNPSPSFQTLSSGAGAERGRDALFLQRCARGSRAASGLPADRNGARSADRSPRSQKKFFFLLFVPSASAPALTAAAEPFPAGWG